MYCGGIIKRQPRIFPTQQQRNLGAAQNDALRALLTELEFFTLLKADVPAAKVSTDGFVLVRQREHAIESEVASRARDEVYIAEGPVPPTADIQITRADASMSPASLSATGFSSVMASSAQNQ